MIHVKLPWGKRIDPTQDNAWKGASGGRFALMSTLGHSALAAHPGAWEPGSRPVQPDSGLCGDDRGTTGSGDQSALPNSKPSWRLRATTWPVESHRTPVSIIRPSCRSSHSNRA